MSDKNKKGECDLCGKWSGDLKEGLCIECARKQNATNNSGR